MWRGLGRVVTQRDGRATRKVAQRRSFLTNRSTVVPHLKLREMGPDVQSAMSKIRSRVAQSPSFFGSSAQPTSFILDLDGFTHPIQEHEMKLLVEELRGMHLNTMAYTNASHSLTAQSASTCRIPYIRGGAAASMQSNPHPTPARDAARITLLNQQQSSTSPPQPQQQQASSTPKSTTSAGGGALMMPTVVIDRSLRSGQQIYARGASLVVLGSVNSGSEVVADGDVYVFGPLVGRVLAGASGNEAAKIITTSFRAELVSISSVYRTGDLFPEPLVGKPAVVWLENGQLQYCNYDLTLDRKRA
jgi:septum site-determining protein MinC